MREVVGSSPTVSTTTNRSAFADFFVVAVLKHPPKCNTRAHLVPFLHIYARLWTSIDIFDIYMIYFLY